jgi:hypothetical protein
MNGVQADLVRRFTAEHAYRMVFATKQDDEVPRLRPRIEDADLFRRERELWATWHAQQTEAEQELLAE